MDESLYLKAENGRNRDGLYAWTLPICLGTASSGFVRPKCIMKSEKGYVHIHAHLLLSKVEESSVQYLVQACTTWLLEPDMEHF